jgi:hypothetical protein
MSENEVRDDPLSQTAVRNLFIGNAPERQSDLIGMWKELDPVFPLTPDIHEGNRIIMDAGAYRYVRPVTVSCGHFGSPDTPGGKATEGSPKARLCRHRTLPDLKNWSRRTKAA